MQITIIPLEVNGSLTSLSQAVHIITNFTKMHMDCVKVYMEYKDNGPLHRMLNILIEIDFIWNNIKYTKWDLSEMKSLACARLWIKHVCRATWPSLIKCLYLFTYLPNWQAIPYQSSNIIKLAFNYKLRLIDIRANTKLNTQHKRCACAAWIARS